MKFKFEFTKNASSTFMEHRRDAAWQHYFFIAQCFERSDPTIRAWQISILWFHLSIWWKSSPVDHAAFDEPLSDSEIVK